MCGRYYFDIDDIELRKICEEAERNLYGDFKAGDIYPANIAPIFILNDKIMKPSLAEWGFPNQKSKGLIINARVETISEKPTFKKLIKTNKCIVPASAFYEWKSDFSNKKSKDKYIISKADSLIYMAGLYDIVTEKNEDKQINLFDYYGEQGTAPDCHDNKKHIYFTIITREANNSMMKIHNRMPLILNKNEISEWLMGKDILKISEANNVDLKCELL